MWCQLVRGALLWFLNKTAVGLLSVSFVDFDLLDYTTRFVDLSRDLHQLGRHVPSAQAFLQARCRFGTPLKQQQEAAAGSNKGPVLAHTSAKWLELRIFNICFF